MSKPLVSIITPTFNHERFIGACIESVLSQTFPDWEMIIVDDASTDGTEAVARSYVDPHISYIRQQHVGPYRMAETYNRALSHARGEFIAILEGDDLWPAYKLARQIPILEQDSQAVACYGRAGIIDEEGNPVGLYLLPRTSGKSTTTADFLLGRSALQPVTALIRRQPLEAIGGFAGHPRFPAVDLPTWLRLTRLGSFQFSDVVLGLWRIHGRQVTANYGILPAAVEVAREFFDTLTPEERARLGVSLQDLQAAHDRTLAEHSWALTLQSLGQRSWMEARRSARAAMSHPSRFRQTEAMLAMVCASAHVDPTAAVASIAATALGRRVVERHNPLAREQKPGLLVATLSAGEELGGPRREHANNRFPSGLDNMWATREDRE